MSLSFVSTGRLLSVCIYYHVRVLQGVIWWHIELYKPTDIELYWVSSPQHLTANKNVNTTSFFLILPFPLSFSIHRAMFCPDLYSFIIFFLHWFLWTSSLSWPTKFNVRRSAISIETFYWQNRCRRFMYP